MSHEHIHVVNLEQLSQILTRTPSNPINSVEMTLHMHARARAAYQTTAQQESTRAPDTRHREPAFKIPNKVMFLNMGQYH